MSNLLKLISLAALIATLVPSALYFCGLVDHRTVKLIALLGTFGWFLITPMWMGRGTATGGTAT